MGEAGAPTPAKGTVSLEDRREMSAVLHYLAKTHGAGAVGSVLGLPADSVVRWADTLRFGRDDDIAAHAMTRLGVKYVSRWQAEDVGIHVWAHRPGPASIPIAGFEVVLPVSLPSAGWIGTATDSLEFLRGDSSGGVVIRHDGAEILRLDLAGAVSVALGADSLPSGNSIVLKEPIALEGEAGGYRVRLVLEAINGQVKERRFTWQSGSGMLLAKGFQPRQR